MTETQKKHSPWSAELDEGQGNGRPHSNLPEGRRSPRAIELPAKRVVDAPKTNTPPNSR